MSKKGIKLLCIGLLAAMLLTACAKEGADGANASGTGTAAPGANIETDDTNNITEVQTPLNFTGNTGDVAIESGDTYAVITIQGFGSITVKLFPEAAPTGVQNFIDLADSGYYSGKEIHRVMSDFMFQGGSRNGDGLSTDDDPSFGVEYNTNMRHYYGALCYANAGGINGSQFYIVNCKTYAPLSEEDFQTPIAQLESSLKDLTAYIEAAESEDERAYYQSYYDYYKSLKNTYSSQLRALQQTTEEMKAKYEDVGGTPFLDGGYTVFGQTVDGFDVIDAVSAVEVEMSSGNELSHPVQKVVIESIEIFTAE